jgi:hypothetical protein
MKTQTDNDHRHGWFSRPGAIDMGVAEKAIRPVAYQAQSRLDDSTVELATGPCQILWQVRTRKPKPAVPANAHGSGFKGFAGRTYARALSPEQQRWANLIAAAKPQPRAKV